MKKYNKYEDVSATKVEAICPYCGKTHMVRVRYGWTGRGKPRIYHERCKYCAIHRVEKR